MPVKFHLSLNVSSLDRAVKFYRILFGMEPAKHLPDYAKFELETPPLVLSLVPGQPTSGGTLNHTGLRLTDAKTLVDTQYRLEAAGFSTQREDGVECCHSRQTKFWVTDPDRTLWEIYVLTEDCEEENDPTPAPTSALPKSECEPQRTVWQHQISEPFPVRIPHDDNSVHQVILEGMANLSRVTLKLETALAEAFRALRPGGEISLHGLAADKYLTTLRLNLPGPAAAVQYVPALSEILNALAKAGFVGLRFEKLSPKPHFEIDGLGLREILITGRKAGHRPATAKHTAIYLGPLAEVRDDFGNIFPRGQFVSINIHDWQALKNGSVAAQFLLLEP